MPSTYQLFERAEQVEVASAAIYAALGRAFRADPEAQALFERLRVEEEQHASRVRLLAAHYRADPKLPVDASFAALDVCLSAAQRALAEIEQGAWGADLAQVKRRLAALEGRCAAAHAQIIAGSASPEVRGFFETLARQDGAHARLLGE